MSGAPYVVRERSEFELLLRRSVAAGSRMMEKAPMRSVRAIAAVAYSAMLSTAQCVHAGDGALS